MNCIVGEQNLSEGRQIPDAIVQKTESAVAERLCGGGYVDEQEATGQDRQSAEMEDNATMPSEIILQNTEMKIKVESSSTANSTFVEENLEKSSQLMEKSSDVDFRSSISADQTSDQSEVAVLGEVNCCKLRVDIRTMEATLAEMKEEICCLKEKIYKITISNDVIRGKDSPDKHLRKCTISSNATQAQEEYIVIKQKQSEYKPTRCTDIIREIEKTLTRSIQCIDKRFATFEEYVNCALKNVHDVMTQNKSEEQLVNYVKCLRSEFEMLSHDVLQLQHDKDTQNTYNETFEEKLNALKCTKAEKIQVEKALLDKADKCALNQKVSHEQFDAACDEWSRAHVEVIEKLSQQESIWQQSLAELRCEIEGKLEELEIPAFKEFINNELQAMKNQIRLLSEIKREQEAAGARKILRNLHCISCDKDAFMRTDVKTLRTREPFPCRPTIAPHLAYKMHEVRKCQQTISKGKNLLHLENIRSEKIVDRENYDEICQNQSRDHICNRYCGGSHTVINQKQMMRIKKICNTGCEGVRDLRPTVEGGFVEGTDGQMYRGRLVQYSANVD